MRGSPQEIQTSSTSWKNRLASRQMTSPSAWQVMKPHRFDAKSDTPRKSCDQRVAKSQVVENS